MPSVVFSPDRFFIDTEGTAERCAMISSALRGLESFKYFFGMEASPAVSSVKRSAESFSAMTPLEIHVSKDP